MICPLSIRCVFIIPLILSSGLILNSSSAFAEDSMELIATIIMDMDSTYFRGMTPIGDFNADGNSDLAVGIIQYLPDMPYIFEAVWIYYGGPDFDVYPDLIIPGEPQNQIDFCEYTYPITHFGERITNLDDYNGDTYDDLAVSAWGFCPNGRLEGRVYIYFGSPEPDTIPDIVIDGTEFHEYFGSTIGSGDFNGDGFGDLLATSQRTIYPDDRAYIYLGSNPPDGIYDWSHDFLLQEIYHVWYQSGFNVNDDLYDDFSFFGYDHDEDYWFDVLFLGGDRPDTLPAFVVEDGFFPTNDVSGDGIDDIMIYDENLDWYLCLGGDPLDLDPDYYIGDAGVPACTYEIEGEGVKLLMDDWQNDRFIFYNTGIPFDTIPYNIISHGRPHFSREMDIGDINADGVGDLALRIHEDTIPAYYEIYSIFSTTGNEEREEHLLADRSVLSCYPNPFNSDALLNFANYDGSDAEIRIYDVVGRLVQTIYTIEGKATWDATDNSGRKVSSGIYFAQAAIPGSYGKPQNAASIKLLYLK